VERQRSELNAQAQQVQLKLAQKTAELQLLQRRVREEAKVMVEAEKRRADGFERQLADRQESIIIAERRAKETEKELDTLRSQMRKSPEAALREEVATLRAQLEHSRRDIEREGRRVAEGRLQAEHYRAQMHRLAAALKRERERTSVTARQELEQLRLEFLAREERYVLDGDRDELRTIRNELALLKLHSAAAASPDPMSSPPRERKGRFESFGSEGFGSPSAECKNSSLPGSARESFSSSSSHVSTFVRGETETDDVAVIANLRKELRNLLDSGLYEDQDDELILEIRKNLQEAEERVRAREK
jgi:hypothetical protein